MASRRRVVTGHDAEGAAIVASDDAMEPLDLARTAGRGDAVLWGADAPAAYPDNGAQPAWRDHSRRSAASASSPSRCRRPVTRCRTTPSSPRPLAHASAVFPGLLETFPERRPPACTAATRPTSRSCSPARSCWSCRAARRRTCSAGDTIVQNGTVRQLERTAPPARRAAVRARTAPRARRRGRMSAVATTRRMRAPPCWRSTAPPSRCASSRRRPPSPAGSSSRSTSRPSAAPTCTSGRATCCLARC